VHRLTYFELYVLSDMFYIAGRASTIYVGLFLFYIFTNLIAFLLYFLYVCKTVAQLEYTVSFSKLLSVIQHSLYYSLYCTCKIYIWLCLDSIQTFSDQRMGIPFLLQRLLINTLLHRNSVL
jgi:hypothetical protein